MTDEYVWGLYLEAEGSGRALVDQFRLAGHCLSNSESYMWLRRMTDRWWALQTSQLMAPSGPSKGEVWKHLATGQVATVKGVDVLSGRVLYTDATVNKWDTIEDFMAAFERTDLVPIVPGVPTDIGGYTFTFLPDGSIGEVAKGATNHCTASPSCGSPDWVCSCKGTNCPSAEKCWRCGGKQA